MGVKTLITLFCIGILAGDCEANYTPYQTGASLNWFQAKSFCEERGLNLPQLNGNLIDLIVSKYPYLKQEYFWGDGRCYWKNALGYEVNLTTSRFEQRRSGSFNSGLSLECFGLPDSSTGSKPCQISTGWYYESLLPACFTSSACPKKSLSFEGICVESTATYSSTNLCSYQQMSTTEVLEKINQGLYLPLLRGRYPTKYWIRLGTYFCDNKQQSPTYDFSVNGDCYSFFYAFNNQTYLMNATDCGKALTKHIICYSGAVSDSLQSLATSATTPVYPHTTPSPTKQKMQMVTKNKSDMTTFDLFA